jgi:hypothetical protein
VHTANFRNLIVSQFAAEKGCISLFYNFCGSAIPAPFFAPDLGHGPPHPRRRFPLAERDSYLRERELEYAGSKLQPGIRRKLWGGAPGVAELLGRQLERRTRRAPGALIRLLTFDKVHIEQQQTPHCIPKDTYAVRAVLPRLQTGVCRAPDQQGRSAGLLRSRAGALMLLRIDHLIRRSSQSRS